MTTTAPNRPPQRSFKRSVAWRLALAALIAAYAWACIGNGLDRMSVAAPALATSVPAPFRAEAEIARAALAMSGSIADAGQSARRAILANPIDRRPVALLGAQRMLAQDYAGAETAFRVGAKLGWREPLTQSYWYRAALQSGDPARAAERLDALLRTDPAMRGAEGMAEPLLATPQGRRALAQRLSHHPGWLRHFFSPSGGASLQSLIGRAEVAALMTAHGAPLDCAQIEPLAARLAQAGRRDTLQSLRADHCAAPRAPGLLADPAFAELTQSNGTAGGWQLHSSGDVTAMVEGNAVAVSNLASVRRPILSQRVDLPMGNYRVLLTIEPGTAQGLFAASLTCGESRAYPDPGKPLAIAATDCPAQTFTLWLQPSRDMLHLRSIVLEPVR